MPEARSRARRRIHVLPILALVWLLSAHAGAAHATERTFGYIYGSDVLNPGSVELEPWTTMRLGRADFYRRFDQRIEFEAGLTSRLQTAFYLNWSAVNAETGTGRAESVTWGGVSSEWKLKLADAVADPIGFALYLEPGLGPEEAEVEGKAILDARRGDWYAALNLGADHEWEFEEDGTEREIGLEADLGISYKLSRTLSTGLEMRSASTIPSGENLESSALFLGPVLSYAGESWWTTVTILPQVKGLEGATKDGLDLADHERVEIRILLGFDL